MQPLTLPPNFEKYNKIIEYFTLNGFDCLSTLQEQFRFFVRYMYNSYHSDFINKRFQFTSLEYKKDSRWGCWNNPDIDSYDYIDIKKLRFYISGYRYYKIDQPFLYNYLINADDITVLKYFNELYDYGKLVDIKEEKLISIGNKTNTATIKIKKENFYKYCGYAALMKEFNQKEFIIDIDFNDNVAQDISNLINEKLTRIDLSIEEFEQKLAVIDYLQVSYTYNL